MTDTKKRAHIVRSFNDAGTGESFTKGDTPLIDVGAYGNYEAAGLVKPAPRAAPAPRPAAKRVRKAATKPAAAPITETVVIPAT